MVLLGICNDAKRLSRTTRCGVSGFLRKRGRHDFVLKINNSISVGFENSRTDLHTNSVPAAALSVREGTQRCTLRSSIQLSHSRSLN